MVRPQWICLLLAALSTVQALYYLPQLPLHVASHFDGNGVPNGWSSRNGFMVLYLVMVAVNVGIFVALPAWIGRQPDARLRLPHAAYWLAPQRRVQSVAFFSSHLSRFGVATLLLLLAAVQLVIEANLRPLPRLSPWFIWLLLAYFVYLALWLVRLGLRFRR